MARNVELIPGHSVTLLQGAQELFPALVQAMDSVLQATATATANAANRLE